MDNSQIFKLIDSVLPLEVCVYHQIVPLAWQGKSLLLGMVDPRDSNALDYVRRMLKHANWVLVPRKISTQAHQSFLSAYLNYKGQTQIQAEPVKASGSATVLQESAKVSPKASGSATVLQEGAKVPPKASGSATVLQEGAKVPPKAQASQGLKAPAQQNSQQLRTESRSPASHRPAGERPPAKVPPAAAKQPAATQAPLNLPVLKVQAFYLSRPIQMLANLPPQQLLPELLGRVLLEGIGRLFLERQAESGRVLWTQQGVLQSAIEKLPLPVFDGLVQEFKHFFNLPYMPVEQPKQVEMERLYNKTHLLLLLQITPGERGEEATLQVLRGEALQFHQQQKIAALSQDALTLAKQLQRKLSEIGHRFDPNLTPETLEALPAIDQLVKSMDQQLRAINTQQSNTGASGEG